MLKYRGDVLFFRKSDLSKVISIQEKILLKSHVKYPERISVVVTTVLCLRKCNGQNFRFRIYLVPLHCIYKYWFLYSICRIWVRYINTTCVNILKAYSVFYKGQMSIHACIFGIHFRYPTVLFEKLWLLKCKIYVYPPITFPFLLCPLSYNYAMFSFFNWIIFYACMLKIAQ